MADTTTDLTLNIDLLLRKNQIQKLTQTISEALKKSTKEFKKFTSTVANEYSAIEKTFQKSKVPKKDIKDRQLDLGTKRLFAADTDEKGQFIPESFSGVTKKAVTNIKTLNKPLADVTSLVEQSNKDFQSFAPKPISQDIFQTKTTTFDDLIKGTDQKLGQQVERKRVVDKEKAAKLSKELNISESKALKLIKKNNSAEIQRLRTLKRIKRIKDSMINQIKVEKLHAQKLATVEKNRAQAAKSNFTGIFTSINRAMGSLSFLFAGQQVKAELLRIQTAALTSFMKITEGSTAAGHGITALSANFEFLKFTLGNAIATALGPYIPTIVNIITAVADWISQHEELATKILIYGTIGAAITTLLAQVILLGAGLYAVAGTATWERLGRLGDAFTNLGTNIKNNLVKRLNNFRTYLANLPESKAILFKIGGLAVAYAVVAILAYGFSILDKYPKQQEVVSGQFKTLKENVGNLLAELIGVNTENDNFKGWAFFDSVAIKAVQAFADGLNFIVNGLRLIVNTMQALNITDNILTGDWDAFKQDWKEVADVFNDTVNDINAQPFSEIYDDVSNVRNNIETDPITLKWKVQQLQSLGRSPEEIQKTLSITSQQYQEAATVPTTLADTAETTTKTVSEEIVVKASVDKASVDATLDDVTVTKELLGDKADEINNDLNKAFNVDFDVDEEGSFANFISTVNNNVGALKTELSDVGGLTTTIAEDINTTISPSVNELGNKFAAVNVGAGNLNIHLEKYKDSAPAINDAFITRTELVWREADALQAAAAAQERYNRALAGAVDGTSENINDYV